MDQNTASGLPEPKNSVGEDKNALSWKRVLAGIAIGITPIALFAASMSNDNIDMTLLPQTPATVVSAGPNAGIPNSGDINGDGRANLVDFAWVNRFLIGTAELTEEQQIAGDVDGSETINAIDKLILRSLIVGNIESVPVRFGDIDNDGLINVRDLVLATRVKDGSATTTKNQKFLANVVRDRAGLVNNEDISAIRAKITMSGKAISFPIFMGDLDNDYSYSIRDLVLLNRIATGEKTASGVEIFAGDINGDGAINSTDVTEMRRLLLNRSTIGSY